MHRALFCAFAWLLACTDHGGRPEAAGVTPPATPPVKPAPVALEAPEGPPKLAGVSVRKYTIDGKELTVTLTTSKASLMVNEPGYAILEFVGDEVELEVEWMGRNDLGRPDNYRVTLFGPGGKALPVPDAGPSFGGQSWRVTPTAAKPFRPKLMLADWVEGLAPGEHTVHAETTVRAHRVGEDAWQDVQVALDVPIEVTADDPAVLGALIIKLGDDAVGADYEASEEGIRKLGVIRDPRVVAQWLRIVAQPKYTHKQAAVRALSAWPDDAALAAIVQITKTRGTDLRVEEFTNEELRVQAAGQLRLSAAQALVESKHPGAGAALLALKHDPSEFVRLTVLHHAATLAGPEGLAILHEYTKDAAKLVRDEAERYLRERR